jgi:hypothetical protein
VESTKDIVQSILPVWGGQRGITFLLCADLHLTAAASRLKVGDAEKQVKTTSGGIR